MSAVVATATDTTTVPSPFRLRPLTRGERAPIVEVFDGLSQESRYRRFHAAMPRLSDQALDHLARVDGRRHVAVVAEVPDPFAPRGWRAIGVARIIATGVALGELAIEVVDGWQGRGVGRQLLEAVRDAAARRGFAEITGSILVGNDAMLGLMRRVFPDTRVTSDGHTWEVRAGVPLAPRRPRRRPVLGRPSPARPGSR